MMIYFTRGKRVYGREPVRSHERKGWEFQAVIRGSIGLLTPQGPHLLRHKTLWLFPPRHSHGWTGEGEKSAEIIVFHFLFVPELIESLVQANGFLEIPLQDRQIERLKELAAQTKRYWQDFASGMMMCYEHVLMDLSMMVWESHAQSDRDALEQTAKARVDFAMQWFGERMEQSPGYEQVARATGVSPAHLRRLFHEVLQTSPQQVFLQMKFQRALQLIGDPAVKLGAIGLACGFGSASSFSRAFKLKFGCSPEMWRSSAGKWIS